MSVTFPSLGARDRRALLLLAAGVAAFLLMDFVVLPGMDSAEKLRASLPLKEKRLRKHQQLVALAGDRETGLAGLRDRVAEAEKGLLASRTAPLAAAELQDLVKQMAAQQGMDLRGADFLPVRPLKPASAGYSVVPVSISTECTLDQLANFLMAARSNTKILGLDQLTISVVPARTDRPRKVVSARVVIRGLMLTEAPPAAAGKAAAGGRR